MAFHLVTSRHKHNFVLLDIKDKTTFTATCVTKWKAPHFACTLSVRTLILDIRLFWC